MAQLSSYPLIVLHGALGAASQFAELSRELQGDFGIHSFDFERHGGEQEASRAFAIENFAENLVSYLDAASIDVADVFGYSMGGYVALYAAARFPERVRRVMTLGTKLAWNPDVATREASFLNAERIAEKTPKFAARLEALHSGAQWKTVVEKTRGLLLSLGEQPRIDNALLRSLRQPVCLALGDRDEMVALQETASAFAELPSGALAVLPQTPHPWEKISLPILAFHLRHFFGAPRESALA